MKKGVQQEREESTQNAFFAFGPYLTANEAARYLGVHRVTLYKMVASNEIAFIDLNAGRKMSHRCLRFKREDLEYYMQIRRTKAVWEQILELEA